MRIRAFDPYLMTRGGGEHYFLEACLTLSDSHTVEIVSPSSAPMDAPTCASIAATFGIDIGSLRCVAWSRGPLWRRSLRRTLEEVALALTVTNDYPLSLASPQVSILQFPFGVVGWPQRRKDAARHALTRCEVVVTPSNYVRSWVERTLDYSPVVLYPPVTPIRAAQKEPIILSVGRLTAGGHNKKHAAMIEAFRRLQREGLSGWRLVLVGSAGPDDRTYLHSLGSLARPGDVKIHPNLDRQSLETLYGKASIYWHAAGYKEDLPTHPERFEHFGMAVVEAMSAGCVPVVLNGGGLPEIVEPGVSGWLWDDIDGLTASTRRLALDCAERARMGASAVEKARQFEPGVFRAELRRLLTTRSLT